MPADHSDYTIDARTSEQKMEDMKKELADLKWERDCLRRALQRHGDGALVYKSENGIWSIDTADSIPYRRPGKRRPLDLKIIGMIPGFLFVTLVAWAGGFDFDSRGMSLATYVIVCALAMFLGGLAGHVWQVSQKKQAVKEKKRK